MAMKAIAIRFEGSKAIIVLVRVGHQGVYKNMPRI